jgi:two-component system NtrC family response regulator
VNTEFICFSVNHYITNHDSRYGTETKGISPEFLDTLAAYDWPGNVRELFNTLERVLASAHHYPTLFPKHLPISVRIHVARASVSQRSSASQKDQSKLSSKGGVDPFQVPATLHDFRESAIVEAEKQYLRNLMSLARGNIKEACWISGLSRPRLYALMKKHQISRLV